MNNCHLRNHWHIILGSGRWTEPNVALKVQTSHQKWRGLQVALDPPYPTVFRLSSMDFELFRGRFYVGGSTLGYQLLSPGFWLGYWGWCWSAVVIIPYIGEFSGGGGRPSPVESGNTWVSGQINCNFKAKKTTPSTCSDNKTFVSW